MDRSPQLIIELYLPLSAAQTEGTWEGSRLRSDTNTLELPLTRVLLCA